MARCNVYDVSISVVRRGGKRVSKSWFIQANTINRAVSMVRSEICEPTDVSTNARAKLVAEGMTVKDYEAQIDAGATGDKER